MLQKTFRMISLVVASAMMITLISAVPCMAASKKPKLVSTVETQQYNKETKTWKTTGRTEYTYNEKGDPIQIDWKSFTGWGNSTRTMDYHYWKNGKRSYATFTKTGREWDSLSGYYSNYTEKGKTTYDKRGHRTREKYKHTTKNEEGKNTGSYSETDKYKHKRCLFYLCRYDLEDHAKTKISIRKKGILKKIRLKYDPDSKWKTRFTFLKKGLIRKGSVKYRYTYYKDTGLVKTIRYYSSYNGVKTRRVIKYTDKSTGRIRYNAMINSLVEPEYFFWY